MSGRSAGGGNATIVIQLDGRTIANAVTVPLQDLAKSGRFTVRAS